MTVKEKKHEKFLITTIKGMEIKVTEDFLSKAFKIHNEDNMIFFNSWFNDTRVSRDQLITQYTKPDLEFNSTNM